MLSGTFKLVKLSSLELNFLQVNLFTWNFSTTKKVLHWRWSLEGMLAAGQKLGAKWPILLLSGTFKLVKLSSLELNFLQVNLFTWNFSTTKKVLLFRWSLKGMLAAGQKLGAKWPILLLSGTYKLVKLSSLELNFLQVNLFTWNFSTTKKVLHWRWSLEGMLAAGQKLGAKWPILLLSGTFKLVKLSSLELNFLQVNLFTWNFSTTKKVLL